VTARLAEQGTDRELLGMPDDGVGSEDDLVAGFQLHAPADVDILSGRQLHVEAADGVNHCSPEGHVAGPGVREKRVAEIDRL
jgi:hypothetical protein